MLNVNTINASNKSLILLDFDDTASLNTSLFSKLFETFRDAGFHIIICTSRSENDPLNSEIYSAFPGETIVFCEGFQKMDTLIKLGINPESIAFWIDDKPSSIVPIDEMKEIIEFSGSW